MAFEGNIASVPYNRSPEEKAAPPVGFLSSLAKAFTGRNVLKLKPFTLAASLFWLSLPSAKAAELSREDDTSIQMVTPNEYEPISDDGKIMFVPEGGAVMEEPPLNVPARMLQGGEMLALKPTFWMPVVVQDGNVEGLSETAFLNGTAPSHITMSTHKFIDATLGAQRTFSADTTYNGAGLWQIDIAQLDPLNDWMPLEVQPDNIPSRATALISSDFSQGGGFNLYAYPGPDNPRITRTIKFALELTPGLEYDTPFSGVFQFVAGVPFEIGGQDLWNIELEHMIEFETGPEYIPMDGIEFVESELITPLGLQGNGKWAVRIKTPCYVGDTAIDIDPEDLLGASFTSDNQFFSVDPAAYPPVPISASAITSETPMLKVKFTITPDNRVIGQGPMTVEAFVVTEEPNTSTDTPTGWIIYGSNPGR